MNMSNPEVAIDEVIAEVQPKNGKKLGSRLRPDEVRSHLADLCSLLHCHFLDLPPQLADIALRDVNTSRIELLNELLELRAHPLVAA